MYVAYRNDLRFPLRRERTLRIHGADPKGHILPSRYTLVVCWRLERRVTLRLDRSLPNGKIVRVLDAIAKDGFRLAHAAVNAELLAFMRTCTA